MRTRRDLLSEACAAISNSHKSTYAGELTNAVFRYSMFHVSLYVENEVYDQVQENQDQRKIEEELYVTARTMRSKQRECGDNKYPRSMYGISDLFAGKLGILKV